MAWRAPGRTAAAQDAVRGAEAAGPACAQCRHHVVPAAGLLWLCAACRGYGLCGGCFSGGGRSEVVRRRNWQIAPCMHEASPTCAGARPDAEATDGPRHLGGLADADGPDAVLKAAAAEYGAIVAAEVPSTPSRWAAALSASQARLGFPKAVQAKANAAGP
jgi:hypothetical protein